jgi:hypothetical protein
LAAAAAARARTTAEAASSALAAAAARAATAAGQEGKPGDGVGTSDAADAIRTSGAELIGGDGDSVIAASARRGVDIEGATADRKYCCPAAGAAARA